MSGYERIIGALNEGGVRYVIVGGMAVVLQGHPRLTVDVDVVLDLQASELEHLLDLLLALGLRPLAPVEVRDFADAALRAQWIAENGMLVFSLHDPNDPTTQVDLFTEEPISFEDLWNRSTVVDLRTTRARIASIEDLITMTMSAPVNRDDAWRALHEQEVLAQASGTPAQRFAWLEEALELALLAGALPRRTRIEQAND